MPGRPSGGEPSQPVSIFTLHLGLGVLEDVPLRDQHHVRPLRLQPPEALPQEPLRAVAVGRAADAPRGGQPEPSEREAVVHGDEGEQRAVQPEALLQHVLELGARAQALLRAEALPRSGARKVRYAPIRLRPLFRRRLRTRRPPLVRMRTRKPCVLFRLRLFGWNVRFMLSPGRRSERNPSGDRLYRTKA